MPLPDGDKYPMLSVSKSVTKQGSWSSPVDRNGLETRQEIQARLYPGPCCSRGQQEQQQRTCSLAPCGGGWVSVCLVRSEHRSASRGWAGGVA